MNDILDVTPVMTDLVSQAAAPADSMQVAEFERAIAQAPAGQGEGLLHKVGQIHEHFSDARQRLRVDLAASADDPAALMDVHWALTKMNLQQELIAKGVGRITQNIETLMKAQ